MKDRVSRTRRCSNNLIDSITTRPAASTRFPFTPGVLATVRGE